MHNRTIHQGQQLQTPFPYSRRDFVILPRAKRFTEPSDRLEVRASNNKTASRQPLHLTISALCTSRKSPLYPGRSCRQQTGATHGPDLRIRQSLDSSTQPGLSGLTISIDKRDYVTLASGHTKIPHSADFSIRTGNDSGPARPCNISSSVNGIIIDHQYFSLVCRITLGLDRAHGALYITIFVMGWDNDCHKGQRWHQENP